MLSTWWERSKLNHWIYTVGVVGSDVVFLGAEPVGMAFEFREWFPIEIKVVLCGCIIIFFGELGVVDVAFALVIEVVDQILDLPALKHAELIDVLFQFRSGEIPVFVFVELVEHIFGLGVELYTTYSIETVYGLFLVEVGISLYFFQRGRYSMPSV